MQALHSKMGTLARKAGRFERHDPITYCSIILIVVGLGIIIQAVNDLDGALTSIIFLWIVLVGWLLLRGTSYHRLYVGFSIISMLTAGYALAQHFIDYPLRPTSWFNNSNSLAYFMALSVIVLVDRGLPSVADWCQVAIYLMVLFLACSHGAFLALFVGVSIWLYRQRDQMKFFKPYLIVIWSAAALVLIFTEGIDSIVWRPVMWSRLGAPVAIGPGLHGVAESLASFFHPDIWHSHNAILQMAYTIGWLPALAVLIIGVLLIWELIKLDRLSAYLMVGWLVVSSMIDYLYWWPGYGLAVLLVVRQLTPSVAWSAVGSPARALLRDLPSYAPILRVAIIISLAVPCSVALADYSSDITEPGYGIASSFFAAGYEASKAFDDDTGTYWMGATPCVDVGGTEWIGQDFGLIAPEVQRIGIRQHGNSGTRVLSGWIQASDDCSDWGTASWFEFTNDANMHHYQFDSVGSHRCWRILADADCGSGYWAMVEVEMMLYSEDPTATPIPISYQGTLSSGEAYSIERSATFGDIAVLGSTVFVGVIGLLLLFVKVAHGGA